MKTDLLKTLLKKKRKKKKKSSIFFYFHHALYPFKDRNPLFYNNLLFHLQGFEFGLGQ